MVALRTYECHAGGLAARDGYAPDLHCGIGSPWTSRDLRHAVTVRLAGLAPQEGLDGEVHSCALESDLRIRMYLAIRMGRPKHDTA